MSFGDYPNSGYFLVLKNGLNACGSFTVPNDLELEYVQVTMLNHDGLIAGNETVTASIKNAESKLGSASRVVATSAAADWSLVNAEGTYWYGFVRFSFNREHIDASQTYYLELNYSGTPTSTRYVGASLDWPLQVNAGDKTAVQMRVFGYRDL